MKLEVIFDCPFSFGEGKPVEKSVFVEFPEIPRVGDSIGGDDDGFAPMFREINEHYCGQEIGGAVKVGFNVVRRISYKNGTPRVMVGPDPRKYLVAFDSPEKHSKSYILSMNGIPKVGDCILYDDWYVVGVRHGIDGYVYLYMSDEEPDC